MESRNRSLIKTITWRVIATFITLAIAFTFTGSFHEATLISLVTAMFLAVGYYHHERFWARRQWGKGTR